MCLKLEKQACRCVSVKLCASDGKPWGKNCFSTDHVLHRYDNVSPVRNGSAEQDIWMRGKRQVKWQYPVHAEV